MANGNTDSQVWRYWKIGNSAVSRTYIFEWIDSKLVFLFPYTRNRFHLHFLCSPFFHRIYNPSWFDFLEYICIHCDLYWQILGYLLKWENIFFFSWGKAAIICINNKWVYFFITLYLHSIKSDLDKIWDTSFKFEQNSSTCSELRRFWNLIVRQPT